MIVLVALINPAVNKLAPVTLPLTLSKPVTYSPVVANTTTLLVPPIVTLAFPFNAVVILVLPLVRAVAVVAATPVN